MAHQRASKGVIVTLAMGALATVLTACGGGDGFESEVRPHHSCVDDSVGCIAKRQADLRVILADRKNQWVHHPANADSYAAGVRLFAFKARKRELTCAELSIGKREADAGPGTLRGTAGRHLTPAQVARGVILSAEISRELTGEMRRRHCAA